MSKPIAYLSIGAALLAGAVLPRAAAAADLYGYGEGPPLAYHDREDVFIDGERARVERREDLRPDFGYGRGPGPAAFEDGGPGWPPRPRAYRRPVVVVEGPDRYGRRPFPPPPPPYGVPGYGFPGYGPAYRPAAAGPDLGYGGPDGGCTTEQARSITPAGWRKTVTYRTCYRR